MMYIITENQHTTDQKIDQILHLLKSHIVKSEVNITTLQNENRSLKLRLMETEGTLVKLSAKVKNLEDKVDSLSIRSMKGNLVFYNISEKDGEDCREVVDNFIRNVLKVPNQYIFSPDNVLGEVCVDVAHCIKHTKSDQSRPIVARFTSQCGRNRVLSF